MIIDYREGIAPRDDRANLEIVRRINSKTVRLMMFCTNRNATWAADRGIKVEAYPIATISFPANRDFFRLDPGDQFKFNYPQWGITDMVCRVLRIGEEDLESGRIMVDVIEDIDHISGEAFGEVAAGKWPIETEFLDPLVNVAIKEAPYSLAGDATMVVPLAAKEVGTENGFYLYMSIDGGSSYSRIATLNYFNLYGTLAAAYSSDTYKIDEQSDGILVDFDVANVEDLDDIQSVTRVQMISGLNNLAILDDEIISFKDVTPVTTTRLKLEGIFRGRFDTDPADHAIGAPFWFLGSTRFEPIAHSELTIGSTKYFKLLPFTTKRSGDISEASAVSHVIEGRGQEPKKPGNLKANGSFTGRYSTDVALTWTPRVRGSGAGRGNPGAVTDAAPTWEYTFEVEVWVSSVLVRTTTDIDAISWTYTQAMNIADNGTLANEILFKVRNVRTADYLESDPAQITVKKE